MDFGVCTAAAEQFGNWSEYLKSVEAWGVRLVEVYDIPEHLPRDEGRVVLLRRLLQSRGVTPISVHGPMGAKQDPSSLDGATRQRAIRENVNSLERTASLGAQFMVYHLSHKMEDENEIPERKKWARDSLAKVAKRAESLGVKLAVENLVPQYLGWSKEGLEELVGPFLGETVGICLDTGHMHVSGLKLGILESWRGRIISFHMHDNNGGEDQHLFPGRGRVDWTTLGQKLAGTGYCGPLMLECKLPQEENVVEKMKALLRI